MFGNTKQLPITLALRGCRPAMMTDLRCVRATRMFYLNMRPRLVEQLGMIERLKYSKDLVTLI